MGIKATLVATVVNLVEDELIGVFIIEDIIFVGVGLVFCAYEKV